MITLTLETKQVQAGSRVRLHGHVTPVKHKHVTIQIKRHGRWRTFGRTRVRPSGNFVLRRRLSVRGLAHRTRLRAKVPRVGRSKPVAVRVRS